VSPNLCLSIRLSLCCTAQTTLFFKSCRKTKGGLFLEPGRLKKQAGVNLFERPLHTLCIPALKTSTWKLINNWLTCFYLGTLQSSNIITNSDSESMMQNQILRMLFLLLNYWHYLSFSHWHPLKLTASHSHPHTTDRIISIGSSIKNE